MSGSLVDMKGKGSEAPLTSVGTDSNSRLEKFYIWIKRSHSKGTDEVDKKKESPKDSAPSGQNGIIPQAAGRESTMAKLRDSLSKLREHLDNLQKRKNMSYETGSDGQPLNGPQSHRNGDVGTDSSDENHVIRDLKAEVMARHTAGLQNGGYDTGDTSLNESDAGSTSASIRGNNDSAYASDRMSHTSASHVTSQHAMTSSVQRRRGRRGSYTSSDQSSPEHADAPRGPQLRKTQSLFELERSAGDSQDHGHSSGKPARIRSASHAQSKVRLRGKNAALSGSDEQLNTWARRKQYDTRRRVHTADVVKRSQSFQEMTVSSSKGRPTSADNDRSFSQMSNNSSIRSGSVKMRRTLPKVPVGAEADIEERKKRMSAEIIRRARAGVAGDVFGSLVVKECDAIGGAAPKESGNTSQTSLQDDGLRLSVIQCGPGATQSRVEYGQEPQVNVSKPCNCEIVVPQPQYSQSAHNNTTETTPALNGYGPKGSDSDASDTDDPRDLYQELQRRVRVRQISQGESSQEALQRIINDLRSAADKPFEGSSSSRAWSRSSGSSITREFAHEVDYPSQEGAAPNTYAQLAEWGVLQPTEDDLASHQYYQCNHPSSQTDDAGEDDQPPRQYSQSSGAYSNANDSESCSDHSDLRVSHPTLHRVLKSCDMIRVSLERTVDFPNFGIEVFESTYQDVDNKEKNKKVFRTPSGRRPVLGRRKGAFIPVAPGGGPEAGPILSLAAVDGLVTGSSAELSKALNEGDFIIEINGNLMVTEDIERVREELLQSADVVHLVVARLRAGTSTQVHTQLPFGEEVPEEIRKDLERLKLKYDALRQEAERSQDIIADLKLDLKERDRHIAQLDSNLRLKDDQIDDLQTRLSRNDQEISEWKYEANHRNVELARLKFETKQKEDRIAQLRRLLIQQSELMQLHHVTNNSQELEDFEEHVSAV